jgi:glycosyltransferase involved in cell wall biosynthesis
MKNPRGLEVEVDASREEELLKMGYAKLDGQENRITRQKVKLDAAFPSQAQYPFGGYGRVVELLNDCFEFNPESKTKIYCGYPRPIEKEEGERSILITMFEADVLPQGWREYCATFDLILVPTEWCKKVFVDSGITQSINVIRLGTDNFSVVQPNYNNPFRILHYNAFSDFKRKGWDLVVKAFIEVFGRQESVELILKGRKHDNESDINTIPNQPNITVIVENMDRAELERLQDKTHLFVFPSRGEGLGLPPIEMMARGVPTIVTNGSGMHEYAHLGIPINTSMPVEARYDLSFDVGVVPHWIEPSLDELKSLMWDVYKHYESYKNDAMVFSSSIKKKYSLDLITRIFQKAIQ